MHFSSLLPLVSGLAIMALPSSVSAIPNAAAFDIWNAPRCEQGSGVRDPHQNVPSDVCGSLPGVAGSTLKVWFWQPPPAAPAQCQFRAYTTSNCTDAFVTYPTNVCEDVSQKHSYKIVC